MFSPHKDRSHIVADGRQRISGGSGWDYADRLRARLIRRTALLSERASFLGRLVIRIRTGRFIRRRLDRLAPPDGLYSSSRFREPIISRVSHEATPHI